MRGGENLTKEEFDDRIHHFLIQLNKDTNNIETLNRLFEYYNRSHNIDTLEITLTAAFSVDPNITLDGILDLLYEEDDTTIGSENSELNNSFRSDNSFMSDNSDSTLNSNGGNRIKYKKRISKHRRTNKNKLKIKKTRKNIYRGGNIYTTTMEDTFLPNDDTEYLENWKSKQ